MLAMGTILEKSPFDSYNYGLDDAATFAERLKKSNEAFLEEKEENPSVVDELGL